MTLFCAGMAVTATLEASSPRNASLMEAVELRNNECRVLLLLRGTVLGAESIIRPYMSLCLRRRTSLLTIVLGEKLGVHFMSRRSRSGDDDHEDGSLRSSLGNHKP